MRAGRLRNRVELQSYTATRDSHGGEVKTWATEATFWAESLPQSGREFVAVSQRMAEVSHLFRCRYRTDVTAKKRLVFDGRSFDVAAYWNPDGRKRELLIACVESIA